MSEHCPRCSESWTASPANVGPPPPGLECPDTWHTDNYPGEYASGCFACFTEGTPDGCPVCWRVSDNGDVL